MGTLNEDLTAIKTVEDTIIANKVANFAYTDEAYKKNDANGVIKYNVNNAQNIPTADPSVLKVNNTVLSQGYRAQASSITRMLMNHFLGRLSYNVNKVNDGFSNLVATLIKHRGTANGFATLDENGRIPYSQLPESAMEYKGQWNAETNTPTLVNGTGTKGDFYVVYVAGTHNFGSGDIQFFVNDRVIYDGSIWSRLSAGDVKTVNNISPVNGNIPLTGENIPVSSTDSTLLSAPLTTDRYANSSVTTEKIADNAVTNAKIKGPISVDKGGTGQSTAKGAQYQLLNDMNEESSDIADSSTFIGLYPASSASVSTGAVYKRKASTVWEYIQGKISSVLGLTATQYNGNAKTATNAVSANTAITATTASSCSGNSATATTASSCSGNSATATKLATTRTINIQDASATNTGTGANFDGSGNATIKLPSTIKANITGNCSGSSGSCTGNSATATQATGVTPFNASQQAVPPGTVTRAVALNVIKYVNGYVSRIALGLTNKLGQFSDGIISLGSDDAGTKWEDFTFKKGTGGEVITSATINNQTVNNAYNAYRGMVHTCSTDAGTASKTVSIPGFTLTTGACIRVLFTNGNSVASPTLNVNNTGAKEIVTLDQQGEVKHLNSIYGSTSTGAYKWNNNVVLDLCYISNYWVCFDDPIVNKNYDTAYLTNSNDSFTGGNYEVHISGRKKTWATLKKGSNFGDRSTWKPVWHFTPAFDDVGATRMLSTVSINTRFATSDNLEGGSEYSYYLSSKDIYLYMYNRNESADQINPYLDVAIEGL